MVNKILVLFAIAIFFSLSPFCQTLQDLENRVRDFENSFESLQDIQKSQQDVIQALQQENESLKKCLATVEKENQILKANLEKITQALATLQETLNKIQINLENGNPWEPFSQDIRDIVADPAKAHEYEYAIYRNGSFRRIMASTWNSGFRVMTEPYMTGDTPKNYMVGGSMWVWNNEKDPNDDLTYESL